MVNRLWAYLDILYRVKTEFGYPTAAYAVSGEYSLVKAAIAKAVMTGGDTGNPPGDAPRRRRYFNHYAAREVARWLQGKS